MTLANPSPRFAGIKNGTIRKAIWERKSTKHQGIWNIRSGKKETRDMI